MSVAVEFIKDPRGVYLDPRLEFLFFLVLLNLKLPPFSRVVDRGSLF